MTQACILSSTSSFFATIALLCINMLAQVKNITNAYVFRLMSWTSLETQAFFSGFKRSHLTVGCNNWLISIHVDGLVSL